MSSAVELRSVLREQAVLVWPKIAPILQRALDVYGEEDLLDVLGKVLLEQYQVYLAVKDKPIAICITEIRKVRSGKTCHIVYVAGDGLTEWIELLDSIEEWCKALGCNRVEGTGRKGWERVLAGKEFRLVSTTLRKQL